MKAIGQTCGHIENLVQSSLSRPETYPLGLSGGTPAVAPSHPVEIGMVFQLLGRERYREALQMFDHLSPEKASDPDALLLRAVLLVNADELRAAQAVCQELLATDDLNASAHYVMALCREHAGDIGAAVEHNRASIYLDPNFAIPHLHLGRLAKRMSDLTTARSEFQMAAARN